MSLLSPERNIALNTNLCLSDAFEIAVGRASVTISDEARGRCATSFEKIAKVISENRHVYGVTTGFGPLANRILDAAHGEELQQNLINHLASGVGPCFPWEATRAIILARVMSLIQGASGAHIGTIDLLLAVLNSGLAPMVPMRGTVGASGDLTPLAHVALALQGKESFQSREGQVFKGPDALRQIGIKPLNFAFRDGLALVNGTSAMTGLAVLNAVRLRRALHWSIALSAGYLECMKGRSEAWNPAFASLRPHQGQATVTALLNRCLVGSDRVLRRPLADSRHEAGLGIETEVSAGQDAYSMRCVPQIIGAVWDANIWHSQVVETELSAVTDNPIFPGTSDCVALHGGNFMGCHVALVSDTASNAATVLAGLVERQVARLTDEKLNNGLPPFLTGETPGLHSGFMGAQVTATALLAEMRTFGSSSTQSISTNGSNQDVVSMGTIAARNLDRCLRLLFGIQAISAMCIAQAIDLEEQSNQDQKFSVTGRLLRSFVRDECDFLRGDRPLGHEIDALSLKMRNQEPAFLTAT